MICSDTVEEREAALEKILPYQQGDFEKLYEALEGCPVTIRFLDHLFMSSFLQRKKILRSLLMHRARALSRLRLSSLLFTSLTQ